MKNDQFHPSFAKQRINFNQAIADCYFSKESPHRLGAGLV